MVRALRGLRVRVIAQLLITRVGMIIAGLIVAGLLFGAVDYLLRWPSSVRMIFWTINVGLLAWVVWKQVVPVLRFRPTMSQLALRLEQSELGQRLGWTGLLTSGLELARPSESAAGDPRLAELATRLASSSFQSHARSLGAALRSGRAWKTLACVALAGGVLMALSAWRPALVRVGMARVLTPWSSAQWPKRTSVEHVATLAAHPRGVAYPLAGLLTRWAGASPTKTNVEASYRVVIDGNAGPRTRVLLTPQSRKVVGASGVAGELFERLIDTQSLVGEASTTSASVVELVYTLATSDDESPERRVRLVEPPAVTRVLARVTPPSYLEQVQGDLGVLRGELDAGTGLDDRGRIGPILAGSRVQLTIELNKDLPTSDAGSSAWLERVLPGLASTAGITSQASARTWTILIPELPASVRTPILLQDEFGVVPREEPALRLEIAEDRAATAAVIEPAQDESVLATARVEATGEGRDDVALWRVALRSQVAKGDPTSPGAVPQLVGEPIELAVLEHGASGTSSPREGRARATIDLGALGVVAGDEVHLTATAQDAKRALETLTPPATPTTSAVRRLRVITESQLVEQVRAQLAGVRESAKKLEVEQRELGSRRDQALGESAEARAQAARQGSIRSRVTPLGETLAQLQQRLERNQLDDDSLRGMLEDARTASDEAMGAAGEAARQLERAGQQSDPALREPLENAQRQAEEALSSLVDTLTQEQDDWAVRRALEQLLTQQQQLRAQTQAAGAQTQGKRGEELHPEQRDDLERIARRQGELAQQAARTIEELEQRAKAMQESSPAQARAMEQAAARARARQLTQRQRAASEQVRQNQTGQAQQSQQAAEEALREALESLEESKQAQEQQLRRVLADLMQSLRTLIASQEKELERLAPALAGTPTTGLDAGLRGLHQNTLGVLAKARQEAAKAEGVIAQLDAAQAAQAAGVVALREEPPDYPQADEMERESLAKLRGALAEAERLEQEAQNKDQQRVRRELRKAYAEALEAQAALKAQADPLAQAEESRRTRNQARALATRQEELRQKLGELRSKTTDLDDAKVFDFAHTRLDEAMGNAAKTLGEGRVARATQRQQATAMRVLASLVEALKEAEKKDQLQDAGGGGGGGQSGQPSGAIPPMAELILLRGMQAEAADRTRSVEDEGMARDPDEVREVTTLQEELARQAQELLEKLQAAGAGGGGGAAP